MALLERVVKSSSRGAYGQGYRFCSVCRKFFLTNNLRCPICNTMMRSKRRDERWRMKNPRINPEELGIEV